MRPKNVNGGEYCQIRWKQTNLKHTSVENSYKNKCLFPQLTFLLSKIRLAPVKNQRVMEPEMCDKNKRRQISTNETDVNRTRKGALTLSLIWIANLPRAALDIISLRLQPGFICSVIILRLSNLKSINKKLFFFYEYQDL